MGVVAAVGAGHRLSDDARPLRVARAPGRINLIGEHIDYCELPVLPMAIDREVRVAFRAASSSRCGFTNADPAFGERAFDLADLGEAATDGDWGGYLMAVARELVECHGVAVGIEAVVSSDLPVAAGLSSSSALVIAAGLALMDANGADLPRPKLAAAMAAAERRTGTRGGGMDQAVSLMAEEGHAALIGFAPLTMQPVALPVGWRFLVADSLVAAEKSGAAQAAYNSGPTLAREALVAIGRALGASPEEELTYGGLISEYGVSELLDEARSADLDDAHLGRFRHVITESDRVRQALEAMKGSDLEAFGSAMNASHVSLRDDCGVSCAELDEIVGIAHDAGASGARLTGAGFGGCTIALCSEESAPSVFSALSDRFYAPRGALANLDDRLFIAHPGRRASVESTS